MLERARTWPYSVPLLLPRCKLLDSMLKNAGSTQEPGLQIAL